MANNIDYKQKYYKYKKKYINLKNILSGGARKSMDILEKLEPFKHDEDDVMVDVYQQDVEADEEYIQDDNLVTRRLAVPSILIVDEMKDEEEGEVDLLEIIDVGAFGFARGIIMNEFDFGGDDFIAFSKGPDKTKILKIDTLDDFDNFTEKYGLLGVDEEGDKFMYVRWDKVDNNYKGVYLNDGLLNDRYESAFYNNNTYPSWWKFEFGVDGVVEFVKPEYKRFSGYKIKKPFNGSIFSENDFTKDTYIEIHIDPDKEKILLIDDLKSFDIFTNKYGFVKTKNDKHYISINWKKVAKDYKGLYIDQDIDIHPIRYRRAFYQDKKYISWWKHYKIKSGIVYVFD